MFWGLETERIMRLDAANLCGVALGKLFCVWSTVVTGATTDNKNILTTTSRNNIVRINVYSDLQMREERHNVILLQSALSTSILHNVL